jgi:hypothetical protein
LKKEEKVAKPPMEEEEDLKCKKSRSEPERLF